MMTMADAVVAVASVDWELNEEARDFSGFYYPKHRWWMSVRDGSISSTSISFTTCPIFHSRAFSLP